MKKKKKSKTPKTVQYAFNTVITDSPLNYKKEKTTPYQLPKRKKSVGNVHDITGVGCIDGHNANFVYEYFGNTEPQYPRTILSQPKPKYLK
jgi:hypothetical protein